jgi:hypothetical protein
MLNQPTLEKLQAMKLHGMAEAFPTQMSGIASHFEQRLRAGAKQQIIDPALILER